MTSYTKNTIILLGILMLLLAWPEASQAKTPPRLHRAANQSHPPKRKSVAKRAWIICQIFPHNVCHQAINVAYCESRLDTRARNGQYLGMFQMGRYERRKYGHSSSAWKQTRAAYLYYKKSGWLPWACKP